MMILWMPIKYIGLIINIKTLFKYLYYNYVVKEFDMVNSNTKNKNCWSMSQVNIQFSAFTESHKIGVSSKQKLLIKMTDAGEVFYCN